jgi:hypothetical protein
MDERELALYVAGDEHSWLRQYVDYARSVTDAPLMFHVGAALVALAGAVGSSVSWTGGGGRENWPHLWILLLAPSGIYRKSTSVDLACDVLERACQNRILDREFSPERFIRNLAEHPTSVLKEAEFSSLLERMKASYMTGLKQRLTELYDCVPAYSRHISGENAKIGDRVTITRPALSVLAASTTDWLVSSVTETDVRSGFLPRFLWFASFTRETEPEGGYLAEPDYHVRNELVRRLGEIAFRRPSHLLVAPIRDQLICWDAAWRERFATNLESDLSGVYSRLAHSAVKIMALLTIAEGQSEARTGDYTATPEICARALTLLDWVVEQTRTTFAQHLVFEKAERAAQKLLALLPLDGTHISKTLIYRQMRLPARELDEIIRTLKERGEVDEEFVATGGRLRQELWRTEPPT